MQKLWVGEVIGSASKGHKAGTLILLHKNLAYDLVSVDRDEEGRLVSIHLKFPTGEIRLTNVYAPNSPDQSYFTDLTSKLAN